jgi:hypothetical protein
VFQFQPSKVFRWVINCAKQILLLFYLFFINKLGFFRGTTSIWSTLAWFKDIRFHYYFHRFIYYSRKYLFIAFIWSNNLIYRICFRWILWTIWISNVKHTHFDFLKLIRDLVLSSYNLLWLWQHKLLHLQILGFLGWRK